MKAVNLQHCQNLDHANPARSELGHEPGILHLFKHQQKIKFIQSF